MTRIVYIIVIVLFYLIGFATVIPVLGTIWTAEVVLLETAKFLMFLSKGLLWCNQQFVLVIRRVENRINDKNGVLKIK